MIRATQKQDIVTGKVVYVEYSGTSLDTKPTKFGVSINGIDVALATGSLFLEVDTGDVYAWNEDSSDWGKICALGGGD